MTDAFEHREKTLENRFFYQQDQKLIEKLRQKEEAEEGRQKLANATGIENIDIIQEMIDQGIRAESMIALSLVPLIFVARADRVLEEKEQDAILEAAAEAGLEPDSASYELFALWLLREPDPELLEVWRHYIGALCQQLPKEQVADLQQGILGRCQQVAKAAGGFLGTGGISSEEWHMLVHIESAFVVTEE